MKTILIDMDGVMADIYEKLIYWEEKISMKKINLNEIYGKFESKAFPHINQFIYSKDFFYSLNPMLDSVEIVKQINLKYNLFIVSAATEFPLSLTEKLLWLNKFFPYIKWQQVVLCGTKEIINGDIMIDDHYKNLDPFKGQTFLYTQPHNVGKRDKNHLRVNSWIEISKYLL